MSINLSMSIYIILGAPLPRLPRLPRLVASSRQWPQEAFVKARGDGIVFPLRIFPPNTSSYR